MVQIILGVLVVMACAITAGGMIILVVLADKPTTALSHAQGFGRYGVLGGSLFTAVQTCLGDLPPWPTMLLVVGLAVLIAIYAREQHLVALFQEHLADEKSSTETGV